MLVAIHSYLEMPYDIIDYYNANGKWKQSLMAPAQGVTDERSICKV